MTTTTNHHPATTAIILIGHGTRKPQGTQQFLAFTHTLQNLNPHVRYYPAFMELAEPSIEDAIAAASHDGHLHILCQPALLLAAGHAKNDLPAILRHAAYHHPHVTLRYAQPIGLSAELIHCCAQHLQSLPAHNPQTTTLLVVGRGTSDPDANANVAKLARLLQEALGYAESDVAYFAATTPHVATGLQRTATRATDTLVVFPFILFPGHLDSHLNLEIETIRPQFPHLQIHRTPPLAHHPDFPQVVHQTCVSALNPQHDLPCLLCKYRSSMPGFETDLGKPQPTDHHHHHHPA